MNLSSHKEQSKGRFVSHDECDEYLVSHDECDEYLVSHDECDEYLVSHDECDEYLINVDNEIEDSDSSGTDDDTVKIAKHTGVVNKVLNLPEKLGELLDCNFYW